MLGCHYILTLIINRSIINFNYESNLSTNNFRMGTRQILISLHLASMIIMIMASPCPSKIQDLEICNLKHVLCAFENETDEDVTVCIQEGYWYGVVGNTNATAPCKYKNCKVLSQCNNECPFTRSSSVQFYEMKYASSNCTDNRKGTLCSECDDDHAFTFGAYECADCDDGYAGAIIISIIFVLLIITGLLFCLRFRDVNLARINGFVLFFSIVDHLVPEVDNGGRFKNDYGIDVFISIFESFSQLQPEFLSFVPFPFVPKSCKALCTVGLQYIFPLSILIFLPSLVPILSNCCPQKCQKCAFGSNTWVKSICLVFLLTFTSLTETSILILQPIQFDGSEGNYILLQPETSYFDDDTHICLFILAIAIEILLTIAVTILLLSPYLTRFRRCNSLKLKPFLDEFHGGYKEKYRFMAASYFIYRQVTFFLTLYQEDASSAIHFVAILMLVLHLAFRPYRSCLINIIDSVFLTSLVFISHFYANSYFAQDDKVLLFRTIIVYILLIFPASYPFLLLILPCWSRVEQCNKYETLRSKYFPCIKNYYREEKRTSSDSETIRGIPLMIPEENAGNRARTRIASFVSSIGLSRIFRRSPNSTLQAPTKTDIGSLDRRGRQQKDSSANASPVFISKDEKDSLTSSGRHLSAPESENKSRKFLRPYRSADVLTKPIELQTIPEIKISTSDDL